jgi:hypothetical protein
MTSIKGGRIAAELVDERYSMRASSQYDRTSPGCPSRIPLASSPVVGRALAVRLNCLEKMGYARSAGWTFNLNNDVSVSSAGTNEFGIEGPKIDPLFAFTSDVPVRYA